MPVHTTATACRGRNKGRGNTRHVGRGKTKEKVQNCDPVAMHSWGVLRMLLLLWESDDVVVVIVESLSLSSNDNEKDAQSGGNRLPDQSQLLHGLFIPPNRQILARILPIRLGLHFGRKHNSMNNVDAQIDKSNARHRMTAGGADIGTVHCIAIAGCRNN